MQEIYDFLTELNKNNKREWFDENRNRYQQTKEQFLHLTEILIHEIRTFDSNIPYQDPKKCMFRIFRDVRFSKDKTPYKTNFGSYITSKGRKGGTPGYYIHLEPGNSFLGGGIYRPDKDRLKAIRTEICNTPEEYLELISDAEFAGSFRLYDDQLKTAPKGFPKDFEHIELIRYKSYAPTMRVSDEQIMAPDFIDFVVAKYKIIADFNRFLNHAISQPE